MTGTLKAQLAQYGMTERLDEVLESPPRTSRPPGRHARCSASYAFAPQASVGELIARFCELKRTRSLRVNHPEFRLDLSRD